MRNVFYFLWLLFPAIFFIIALWGKLEELGNKEKHENSSDFFRQGLFLLGCAGVTILIDRFLLDRFVASVSPDYLPLWFWEGLLFPAVLYIVSKLLGPSQNIRITKPPRPTQRGRHK